MTVNLRRRYVRPAWWEKYRKGLVAAVKAVEAKTSDYRISDWEKRALLEDDLHSEISYLQSCLREAGRATTLKQVRGIAWAALKEQK